MENEIQSVLDIIYSVTSWHDYGEGHYSAIVADNYAPDGVQIEYHVTKEELAKAHPLLSGTLQIMFDDKVEDGLRPMLTARCVAQTLELLNKQYIEISDVGARRYKIMNISGIIKSDMRPDLVTLRASKLTTQTGKVNDQLVDFVVSSFHGDSVVSISALEQDYLGWEKRWTIASELGIDPRDMLEYVFLAIPTKEYTLGSEVKFE